MERILRSKEIFEIIPFDYSQPAVFFPIRHHSPACSYHLLKTIEAYQPDCILVEGPKNADKLIPVLTNEKTVLPVAFYYFYKDKAKHINEEADDYKCYYPFLYTSPEYNALSAAVKKGIDCSFIDLPYGEMLINTSENKGIRTKREIPAYNDDYYLSESKYFETVCEKTGMRNFEEFWENFFEIDALYIDTEEFVSRMLTYCYLLRKNTPIRETIEDGCAVRERYMAENIIGALETHSRVLVVTGGFHTSALFELVHAKKKQPKLKLHHFDESVQNVYAMAYSYEAADALNGYASGMQNPGFYNSVWKKIMDKTTSGESPAGAYEDTALETILKCAKAASKSDLLITMSDISSAVTMYRGLSVLRDKKEPGLFELYDGVQSCFVKGELNASSELPIKLLRQAATGSEIGRLCESAEKIPIVLNFEEICRKYKLKIDQIIEQKIELDLFSKQSHLEISRFLYRMNFLGTGFGKKLKGADLVNNTDRSRIREIWSYRRTAETEAALIDVSAYGGTVEEACTVLAARRLREESKCSEAAKLYVECFLMSVSLTEGFAEKMNDIIINDGDFFSLGKAVYYFNMLHSLGRMYKDERLDSVYFMSRCFRKLIVMLPSMINIQSEYSNECIKICKMLYNLAGKEDMQQEYEMLISAFETMIAKSDPEPALYGAVLGLLYSGNTGYKTDIKNAFEGYLTGTEDMRKQGAVFLRGLFLTARDIVLVGNEFVVITDQLIKSLPMESFVEVLPELRLAFSYFTPSETDSIAEKAAALYGTGKAEIKKRFYFNQTLYSAGLELDRQICSEIGEAIS